MKATPLLLLSCLALSCQPRDTAESPAADAPPAATTETPTPAEPMEPSAPDETRLPSDPESYVGMTAEAAGARADAAEIPHRINEIDGESQPVTMDFRPERLNFAIKDGVVIRVTKG